MPLGEMNCRKAAAKAVPYKLTDGEGLYLFVTTTGARCWRFDYRFKEKRRTLAFGVYPDVSLAKARERRYDARKMLADGLDPAQVKKEEKKAAKLAQNSTFEVIGREWYANQMPGWKDSHADRVLGKLEQDVFPALGSRPIAEIEAPEILEMLRTIEARGAIETSKRTRQYISAIFRFAIATDRAKHDPSAHIGRALKASPKVKHRAKLDAADLPEFLRALASYEGDEQTQLAIRLTMLTLLRTGEVRFGAWKEIADLDSSEPVWRIPGDRMKMGRDHIVPLSLQAVTALRRLRQIAGKSPWIVPATMTRTGVISENTMLYALYRMGYHSRLTVHGFRGTASTILNEQGFKSDWIEIQLAHAEKNAVRAAYNAAEWLPDRRRMLGWWADYLDKSARAKKKATTPAE